MVTAQWFMAVKDMGVLVGTPSRCQSIRASNTTVKCTNGRKITDEDKPEILRVFEETGNLMETARRTGWSDSQVKRVVYRSRN